MVFLDLDSSKFKKIPIVPDNHNQVIAIYFYYRKEKQHGSTKNQKQLLFINEHQKYVMNWRQYKSTILLLKLKILMEMTQVSSCTKVFYLKFSRNVLPEMLIQKSGYFQDVIDLIVRIGTLVTDHGTVKSLTVLNQCYRLFCESGVILRPVNRSIRYCGPQVPT